ncbi:MAG: Pyridoxal phosphate homeostasis protein [Desulfovibrio sp.]
MSLFLPENEAAALRGRFESVLARLAKAAAASGRKAEDIRLIAISKTHPSPVTAELAALWSAGTYGSTPVFGENYVQEAVQKQTETASLLLKRCGPTYTAPEWHFTGHVQSRKAKDVTGRFTLIHTLDSEKLAMQISKSVIENNLGCQEVLVQINIGEEPQKSGVYPEDAEKLLTAVLQIKEVRITGLMCLPPNFDDAETSRPYFTKLRALRDALRQNCGIPLPHLSMGMSHDCEAAIEEGATMVRIGTDIFGERAPKA